MGLMQTRYRRMIIRWKSDQYPGIICLFCHKKMMNFDGQGWWSAELANTTQN